METTTSPRATFQQQVLDRLGLDICAGRYAPGQTLPRENELCERFALSRIVIREAVKSLAAKGMLEVRRKVGTLVLAPSSWNLFDPDIIAWRTQAAGDDLEMSRDLLDLRRIVEPAAARLAAARAGDADLAAVRGAFERMRRAVAGDGDYVAADLAFHSAIFTASGNQFVSQILVALTGLLRQGFAIVSRKPGGPLASLPLHEDLCRAVEARDPAAAERAALALIDRAALDLRECLPAEPRQTGAAPDISITRKE
ncbi:FadR/GntR family transcriptional regulator [Propionivibrio sp.]|uniref:FadR/GntR family transcriptional regulator n=1 Tax=Propionivibrio sp. TaxID=2212460 RepID=UPI0039E45B76